MCSCDSAAGPAVYREETIKARVEHQCFECGQAIQRGARYVAISGLWDGRWDNFKRCLRCRAVSEAFHDAEGCYAPIGHLLEQVRECFSGPGAEAMDGGASFRMAMRMRLLEMRGKASRAVYPANGFVYGPTWPDYEIRTGWYGGRPSYAVDANGAPL